MTVLYMMHIEEKEKKSVFCALYREYLKKEEERDVRSED